MFLNIFSTKFSTTKCVVYQYFTNFITKVVKSGAKMVNFLPFCSTCQILSNTYMDVPTAFEA